MGKKGGGRNAFVKTSAVSREDAIGPADGARTEVEAPRTGATAEAAASDAPATTETG